MYSSLETICIATYQRTFNNHLILYWEVGDRKYVKELWINAPEQFLDWVIVQSSSYVIFRGDVSIVTEQLYSTMNLTVWQQL